MKQPTLSGFGAAYSTFTVVSSLILMSAEESPTIKAHRLRVHLELTRLLVPVRQIGGLERPQDIFLSNRSSIGVRLLQ